MRRKDFALFDAIMIYTKQRTPLASENSEMAVIGLSLKWRQPSSSRSRFSVDKGKVRMNSDYYIIQDRK